MRIIRRTSAAWLALALTTRLPSQAQTAPAPVAPPPSTAAAGATDKEEALRQTMQELDQRLRILERKREIEAEQAADKARTASSAVATKDGFQLRSADGSFVLKLRGYVQLDGRFFQDDEARKATDTFILRRVRPIVEGTVWGRYDFRIMPDFGAGTTALQDAYVDARFSPHFGVKAGKLKPPLGLERLQSGSDILFVERGQPTNLVPNRDLGVLVHGDFLGGAIAAQLGAFNGAPDGASADVDTDDGKDIAGRLWFQPFLNSDTTTLRGLGFGVAASSGHPKGSVAAPGLPAYKSPGQLTYFSYRADGTAAGTAFADGSRDRLAPQLSWYVGPFGLLAEYVRSSSDVVRGSRRATIDNTAWQLETSWVLFGGLPSYKAVTPKAPFDAATHTWGALELKARVTRLEIDKDAFPLFADVTRAARRASVYGLGLNWYLNKAVRLDLDYERTSFDGGAATGDRPDEKAFLSRFQISF